MELLIHEFTGLFFILKARKRPTVGAVVTGHALHVFKEKNNLLYAVRPVFSGLKRISPYIAFHTGGRLFFFSQTPVFCTHLSLWQNYILRVIPSDLELIRQ